MTGSPTATASSERVPSVLAVLVVRDADAWLRETLAALASQTYPRLAVIAVDNASTDGSAELLEHALGERRIITLPEPRGLAGSLRAALELPAASEADFVLLLNDGAAMDPDGVMRLIEAAVGIGVDRVGVVGAKVVDWDHPRRLIDVGRSADVFGHSYAPLQSDEIDQGQFDRVLEVLCVSPSSMLIAREAWQRAGVFDERLDARSGSLDFCWRVRVAGFRVLMTPLARTRQRAALPLGKDSTLEGDRGPRYMQDRAAFASMLKNYSLLSLVWILPLSLVLGSFRLAYLLLARRFEEAFDVLSAWGWNVSHLPGTLARRRRVKKTRRMKDRQLRRFMDSAGMRLPRWFQTAEKILEEQREIDAEDEGRPVARKLRDRTASLVSSHPVIVASFFGLAIGAVVVRSLLGPETLAGGVLASFPSSPSGFIEELVSSYRTTGLGGSLSASPALGALAGLSWLTFSSTGIAQKVVLAGAPVLAAILLYRAAVRLTGRPSASVLAAAAYVLSGLMLWSFSEGRLDLLIVLAVLPAATERLEAAFASAEPTGGRWRLAAGLGVTMAVLAAFLPGAALALALVVAIELLAGSARLRGLSLTGGALVMVAVLLFPFVPTLISGGGAALGSSIGTTDPSMLARLTPGGGPGTWEMALFLPIAAVVSFALVGAEHRAKANRAAAMAVVGLALSWLSAAGWMPGTASNPLAYLALAGVGEVLLIAYGLASVFTGLGRESFGLRQIGSALLALILGAGLLLQSVAALVGGWAVGSTEKIPAAWAVVSGSAQGDFRVLWVGADDGTASPAPGGDAQGIVEAGAATLRFAIGDRNGVSALDIGRPTVGPGPDALRDALGEILSDTTKHGGALLAPFGVRYVVADAASLPPEAETRLTDQLDLNLVPAAGLAIYRNVSALPPAAILQADQETQAIMASATPADVARLGRVESSALAQVEDGWAGGRGQGAVFVSSEFHGSWELTGTDLEPRRAFGWATSFDDAQAPVSVRHGAQLPATIQAVLLALVWIAALWITRKPVAR